MFAVVAWARLGTILGTVLRLLWLVLGPSSPIVGPSWWHLGTIVGKLDAETVLEPSGSHLGAVLGHLRAVLGLLGVILGPSWNHLGAV